MHMGAEMPDNADLRIRVIPRLPTGVNERERASPTSQASPWPREPETVHAADMNRGGR